MIEINVENLLDLTLPPRIRILIRGMLSPVIGFTKSRSWDDATRKSAGYANDLVIDSAADISERSATQHTHLDSRTLQLISAFGLAKYDSPSRVLRVLDIGGADGLHYRKIRQAMSAQLVEWTILETPAMIAKLTEKGLGSGIRWVSHFEETDSDYDIVLLSSVIQYVTDPYAMLRSAAARGKKLVINRLPLIDGPEDVPTIQHLRMYGRRGSYPAWFLSREKFFQFLAGIGGIQAVWDVPEDLHVLGFRSVKSIGLLVTPAQHNACMNS
jgi:putative methyltransferase (TIGR04325 family)